MFKPGSGFILLCCLLAACKNNEHTKANKETDSSQSMGPFFKSIQPPYQLSDTGLLKNSDTASLPAAAISSFIPDSIKNNYFGKKAVIKYSALVRFGPVEKESYYVVKAVSGAKKAAFLLAFDNENNFASTYPFLLPDEDPNTSQISSVDKKFTITKSVMQRSGPDVVGEGKEVVAYDATARNFSIIMTDALHDYAGEMLNPIDTFPKTHKLAGDYYLNKKNMVSIRDGRYPNQLLVYIHTENNEGDCKGQLKGEFLVTSSATAVYRHGGDPCVLTLSFSGNAVSIKEETGCGNYRGLDCPLTGSFNRKKTPAVKDATKKKKQK